MLTEWKMPDDSPHSGREVIKMPSDSRPGRHPELSVVSLSRPVIRRTANCPPALWERLCTCIPRSELTRLSSFSPFTQSPRLKPPRSRNECYRA